MKNNFEVCQRLLRSEVGYETESNTYRGYNFVFKRGNWKATEGLNLYLRSHKDEITVIYLKVTLFSENFLVEQTIKSPLDLSAEVPFWVRKIVHNAFKFLGDAPSIYAKTK